MTPITVKIDFHIASDGSEWVRREHVVGMLEALSTLTMVPETREEVLKLALHVAKGASK